MSGSACDCSAPKLMSSDFYSCLCPDYSHSSDSTCVCDDGFYNSATLPAMTCSNCNPICNTCNGGSANQCTSCNENNFEELTGTNTC